ANDNSDPTNRIFHAKTRARRCGCQPGCQRPPEPRGGSHGQRPGAAGKTCVRLKSPVGVITGQMDSRQGLGWGLSRTFWRRTMGRASYPSFQNPESRHGRSVLRCPDPSSAISPPGAEQPGRPLAAHGESNGNAGQKAQEEGDALPERPDQASPQAEAE